MQSASKTPDHFLDADHLRGATFVRHIEVYDMLESTNNRAVNLARDANLELPALIVARLQTAGRGRGRNIWWSADGALTFSLLLDQATTGIAPASWPQLSLTTAVAVCDALAPVLRIPNSHGLLPSPQSPAPSPQLPLAIKWPNDVLAGGGKVCGILIESPGGSAPAKDRVVIGIGINANNSWRGAPREAGSEGTALCDITGKKHDLQVLLVDVLNAFATRIGQLRQHDTDLVSAWQQIDCLSGQSVTVETGAQTLEGECVQIADDGALVINTLFGQQRIYSGSIRGIEF